MVTDNDYEEDMSAYFNTRLDQSGILVQTFDELHNDSISHKDPMNNKNQLLVSNGNSMHVSRAMT